MMHCATSQLVKNAYRPCIRVMMGSNAPHESGFSSTWTWAAAISLRGLLVGLYFSVEQVQRFRKAKEATRLKPDYDLLDEIAVILDKLAGVPAQKVDLAALNEMRSRVRQAERRTPTLPFGSVVAHIDSYQKTILPDCFTKRLTSKKITLEDLLDLSRQQGAALVEIRTAIEAVQQEIERRTA